MSPTPPVSFVEMYTPLDHGDLALVKELLDRHGVRYYVKNEFGAVGHIRGAQGLAISVMVDVERRDDCDRLLAEHRKVRSADSQND